MFGRRFWGAYFFGPRFWGQAGGSPTTLDIYPDPFAATSIVKAGTANPFAATSKLKGN